MAALHVLLDDVVKFSGDVVAAQGHGLSPSINTEAPALHTGAGQADADVGMLARQAVNDAAHHGDLHGFNRDSAAPHRHLCAQVVVDLLGQLPGTWCWWVRPQPGHAVTLGTKDAGPGPAGFPEATTTSACASPGCGVSETRMVSPMPSCNKIDRAVADATVPLVPMPASVRPRCRA